MNGAVRVIERPDFWFFLDRGVWSMFEGRGDAAARDPSVCKVLPEDGQRSKFRTLMTFAPNVLWVNRSTCRSMDRQLLRSGRQYFDGKLPLFHIANYTMIWALSWLCLNYRRIILIGCDFQVNGRIGYVGGPEEDDRRLGKLRQNFDSIYGHLQLVMRETAERCPVEWYCNSPGRLGSLMPRFPL